MKKGLAIVLALVLVFGVAGMAFAQGGGRGQPAFDASIDITSEPEGFTVQEGDTLDLKADWATNRDVTRENWFVSDLEEEPVAMFGAGEVAFDGASAGESAFVFDATGLDLGDYKVYFTIWHHKQERNATGCVTITVTAANVEECPAAPAIAARLLQENGVSGRDFGGYISAVSHEMGSHQDDENGSWFWGIDKCILVEGANTPNPAYAAAIDSFLKSIGAY